MPAGQDSCYNLNSSVPCQLVQSELFLKNWICAGNAANYTARGRAYNPMSGE